MARLHLRPVVASDHERVLPWLPEAVAALQGRGAPVDRSLTLARLLAAWAGESPAGATFAAELVDGSVIGLLRITEAPDSALVFDALAVRADLRNLGYGQEMVITAEESFASRCTDAYAGVPRTNGLAIYFWLRAGYRPLYPTPAAVATWLTPGRLWMGRSRRED